MPESDLLELFQGGLGVEAGDPKPASLSAKTLVDVLCPSPL